MSLHASRDGHNNNTIHICQSGSCRRQGSEAVLLEIEELVSAVDNKCKVEASGCLGLCSQAPSAIVVKRNGNNWRARSNNVEEDFTRINTLQKSVEVVAAATGEIPDTSSSYLQTKLAGVRAIRSREEALTIYRWNGALESTLTQIGNTSNRSASNALLDLLNSLFLKAGFEDMTMLARNCNPPAMPTVIEKYSKWILIDVTVVSKHTAIIHLISKDRKRGTPHPRGGGRPAPVPKLWHTTMLAEVGWNEEGPLPWIERDYTPISSALEWERGVCDILIKIYNNGAATSWLHRIINADSRINSIEPPHIWFSQPLQTLDVPGLVNNGTAFYPSSILLMLAGSGVVVLPQILCHREPYTKLGISTPRRKQLHVPIDLIFSCRMDDILMLPEIIKFCQQSQREGEIKGIRSCTLLLTGTEQDKEGCDKVSRPFENFSAQTDGEDTIKTLQDLPNAQVMQSRLTLNIVQTSLSRMAQPCRVIVSGPSGFNAAARGMLISANVNDDKITILEA